VFRVPVTPKALAARPGPIAEAPARTVPSVTAASATRDEAAAWLAGQVSGGAVVACDPAMCAALAQRGIPAGNLLVLGPGSGDPLGSAVVVETAAVRTIFCGRLASVYAPAVLARFGTGAARIEVRIVALDGTASYRRALATDIRARQSATSCCVPRGSRRRRQIGPRWPKARSTRAC
jgi:hypothetical protein